MNGIWPIWAYIESPCISSEIQMNPLWLLNPANWKECSHFWSTAGECHPGNKSFLDLHSLSWIQLTYSLVLALLAKPCEKNSSAHNSAFRICCWESESNLIASSTSTSDWLSYGNSSWFLKLMLYTLSHKTFNLTSLFLVFRLIFLYLPVVLFVTDESDRLLINCL